MILGYGTHGRGSDAVRLFETMPEHGIKPDAVAYGAVLNACSHSGLVEDALKIIKQLRTYIHIIQNHTYSLFL